MSHAALPRPVPPRGGHGPAPRDWIGPAAAAATLGIHALVLVWLLTPRVRAPAASPLQVEWIRVESPPPVPAMPQAPARPTAALARPDRQPPPRSTKPPEPHESADASVDAPVELALDALPDSATLLRQMQGAARAQDDGAGATANGLLERPAPRLPGRGEAFVEGFHVRQQASPADYVAMVGSLLFGGYQGATCSDIRRKITSDISDAERIKLIHDEREICRRGEAGTYRH